MRALTPTGFVLVCLAAAGTAPAAAQEVGTAAAVNPASTGTPPGHRVRTLSLGSGIVHNEHIHTDGRGSVQLVFTDRTAMSIGPNSDVTIDEYVFDPRTNTGKLAVRVGKGVMRFVGGQVSHSGNATVTTPSASIGIRGGTGIIEVRRGRTRTVNLFGHQTVAGAGGQAALYRPGYMLDVSRAGGADSAVPTSSRLLASYNSEFQAKRGQRGGRRGRLSARYVEALANAYNVTGTITTASNGVQSRTACGDPNWQNWQHWPTRPNCFVSGNGWGTTALAVQQGQQSAAARATAALVRIPTSVAPTPVVSTPVVTPVVPPPPPRIIR